MKQSIAIIISTLCLLTFACDISAKVRPDTLVIGRMFRYAATVDTTGLHNSYAYSYKRSILRIDKRNITLLAVPSMYVVAHGGKREYATEAYERMDFHDLGDFDITRINTLTTIPHHRRTLPTLMKYLTLQIYNETMVENYMLSPFCKSNRKFYKYKVTLNLDGTAEVTFRPRADNTQLVEGSALIDYATGRVISAKIKGEYDMIYVSLSIIMGESGVKSLLPIRSELDADFRFVGNKINTKLSAHYGLPKILNDSIKNAEDINLMQRVRPDTLSATAQMLINEYYLQKAQRDSTRHERKPDSKLKKILWDVIGDHLVNRIKSNFGANNQGYIRINPIINPLYMGYSHRRGLTYKFDVRGSYDFSDNCNFWARIKSGYSFKQKQFYYRIPMMLYYNKRKNGYIQLEIGNGNRIRYTTVADKLEKRDTISWELSRMHDFKDAYVKLLNNFDITDNFGFQAGLVFHHRSAIDKEVFVMVNRPTVYRSFAPMIGLQWRPSGWRGPILQLDYERSIKGMLRTNTAYERWELDAQWMKPLSRLRMLSFRLGAGFYTWKDKNSYFLDYTNFRENNIPGGWNDDWSGEFELLDTRWYNESDYYARANVTYESPLLMLSWLPLIGHFFEIERIYVSALSVKDLVPYFEIGYGFTTRWLTIGAFVSNKNGKFHEVGCKFGFELFRHW